MKHFFSIITLLLLLSPHAWGQDAAAKDAKDDKAEVPKVVLVHADTVTQKLVLPPDLQGREPVVELRMCFNELANTVWVSLQSSRHIFGLQSTVRYEEVFTKGYFLHFGGKFKTANLPYEVTMDPKNKPRLKKNVRKAIGKWKNPRFKHYFRPWVSSTDMTSSEVPCEMLTTRLERVFKVHVNEDSTHIQLRDLFLLDHKGMTPRLYKKFVINQHHDFNLELNLLLHRNPCLGKEEEIAAAKARLTELREAYSVLNKTYQPTKTLSAAAYDAFHAHRDSLVRVYPLKDLHESCLELQELNTSYNLCVDSIIAEQRVFGQVAIEGSIITSLEGAKELDAVNLVYKARQLDELTALWLVTKTHAERLSIRQQCGRVMRDAERLVVGSKVVNDDQRNALTIYRKALKYYSDTVK